LSTSSIPAKDFGQVIGLALLRSGFLPPAADEVRVVVFDSSHFAPFAAADGVLDDAEKHRASRFRFAQDRSAYILSHSVWRIVLADCLGTQPADVPLASAPSGQPQLPGTALSTSLSHSGNWVAMAICAGATVGVDIEQTPTRTRLSDMVDVICTPDESAKLKLLPAKARENALLVLWTRKEALLKAFGLGLAVEPSTLSAETGLFVTSSVERAGLPRCRVHALELPAALVGALAAPENVSVKSVHWLNKNRA
jgi:4'-phosphopantetheinyl transferase